MDIVFFNHAIEVLETLIKAINKKGRYKNSRRQKLRRYCNHMAMQRIKRARERMKTILKPHSQHRAREPPIRTAPLMKRLFLCHCRRLYIKRLF